MKTKEDILFECWHKSNDTAPTNETILKAMDSFAREYHKEQLRLNGVGRSLPTNREQLSELVDKVYYKQIDEIEFDTVEDSFRLGIEFGIEELMPSENG